MGLALPTLGIGAMPFSLEGVRPPVCLLICFAMRVVDIRYEDNPSLVLLENEKKDGIKRNHIHLAPF